MRVPHFEVRSNSYFLNVLALIFVEPTAGKRDIVVTILVRCIRPWVHASDRICPDHNLYSNAWIPKQFGTVVALEEEKCHLKHFFR